MVGAAFAALVPWPPLILLTFLPSGAAFAAVSRRTVLSSDPTTFAMTRLLATGCNSLMRLTRLLRCSPCNRPAGAAKTTRLFLGVFTQSSYFDGTVGVISFNAKFAGCGIDAAFGSPASIWFWPRLGRNPPFCEFNPPRPQVCHHRVLLQLATKLQTTRSTARFVRPATPFLCCLNLRQQTRSVRLL